LTPAPIATSLALFRLSACGVTVTVRCSTRRGAGPVYVAESARGLPLAIVSSHGQCSQELPLQPGPLSAQASVRWGSTRNGRQRATIVAVPPARRMARRVAMKNAGDGRRCEICFEGSATLCAVSVVLAGEGRVRVRRSSRSRPTVRTHSRTRPKRLQRIVVSGCPLLVTVA